MATTPTQYQEYRTGFAEEIAPYAQNLLGKAELATDTELNPYMQYMGDRVAQFTPLMQQSYENAALMQGSPQLQDATAMAGSAGLGALNTAFTYNPFQTKSFTSPQMAESYMSPYMQNVVERQQNDANRQAAIAQQAQGAQAARSGAFGGSGDYLMRAQGAANLARQKGDIFAQGQQAAYQQGMGQFNAEQAATQAAANLNAQQGQFGAGLGLQGLQTALTGANALGNLGNTQYQQNMGINQMQNAYGLQQQTQEQNILNNQYQDFLNYQNYPYKQMGFMSDMIRGLPLAQQSSSMYAQPPSMLQQVAGAGLVGKGLNMFAKGGAVDDRPAGLADLAIYRMGQD
jgi:hypothetical protein